MTPYEVGEDGFDAIASLDRVVSLARDFRGVEYLGGARQNLSDPLNLSRNWFLGHQRPASKIRSISVTIWL